VWVLHQSARASLGTRPLSTDISGVGEESFTLLEGDLAAPIYRLQDVPLSQ